MCVQRNVELLEEFDGLQVLVAAVLVRNPLAFLARIVEIQHRRHGVDTQRVDMEFLDPEKGAADQVIDNLAPAVVEDQRAPVGMGALARVGVFVQRRPVKQPQAVLIAREVGRYPVHDHADTVLVAGIDKVAEIIRRAETLCRRKHADGLVAPGAVERMLRDGQQFDMRESEVLDVRHELACEVAIGQVKPVILAAPGP